jgi:hypothetical protein
MRPPRLAAVVLSVGLAGCAGLIVRDGDYFVVKTGKVFARTLLCLSTYCISESMMESAKAEDFQRQGRAYLAARVGRMTYDDALSAFGAPTSVAEGSDVFTALWTDERAYVESVGQAITTEHHGYRMQLNFDNATKVLRAYDFERW